MRVLIKPQAALSLASTSHHLHHHQQHLPNHLTSRIFSKRHVHLHGTLSLKATSRGNRGAVDSGGGGRLHRAVGEQIPPDPDSLASREHLEESVKKLSEWFDGKSNVLCLTGAGISTESGIPDYRGHGGSYRKGHKPMVHDQFVNSGAMRQRYWGRAMAGWRDFANADPNEGHIALAKLEQMGKIGVTYPDNTTYHPPTPTTTKYTSSTPDPEHDHVYGRPRTMSILTQNVDGLHRKAATRHVTELHGRNDRVRCMRCGAYESRYDFHDRLEERNGGWLADEGGGGGVEEEVGGEDGEGSSTGRKRLRPDGDAYLQRNDYSDLVVPPCPTCLADGENGFVKPDVVFFGDSVPKHRVDRCYGAVGAADGLLCVGSSLAVHSAYRFVLAASKGGIPVAVLNVGETRAEVSGLDVWKVEAPSGPTLSALVRFFEGGV